jgi:hypothetical protein
LINTAGLKSSIAPKVGLSLRKAQFSPSEIALEWLRDVEINKTISNMTPLEAAMSPELN